MPHDPRVDAYIAASAPFAQPILTWLRARVHAACPDMAEAIKWGMPAFVLEGRPFANMAAFKAHATFGLWERAERPTGREGEAMGQFGRITAITDLPDAARLEAMIRESAARRGEAGPKPRNAAEPRGEAEVPAALAEALAADGAAAARFAAMPPSARRDYAVWIGEAKRDETRAKRVAEAVGWIREGKKRDWKYQR